MRAMQTFVRTSLDSAVSGVGGETGASRQVVAFPIVDDAGDLVRRGARVLILDDELGIHARGVVLVNNDDETVLTVDHRSVRFLGDTPQRLSGRSKNGASLSLPVASIVLSLLAIVVLWWNQDVLLGQWWDVNTVRPLSSFAGSPGAWMGLLVVWSPVVSGQLLLSYVWRGKRALAGVGVGLCAVSSFGAAVLWLVWLAAWGVIPQLVDPAHSVLDAMVGESWVTLIVSAVSALAVAVAGLIVLRQTGRRGPKIVS